MNSTTHNCIFLASLVLGSAFVATPAHGSWPHDPSLNVSVCTAAGSQDEPVAIRVEDGSFFVAWRDDRTGFNAGEVYCQHFSAVGNALWPANGILVGGIGSLTGPITPRGVRLVSDGAGGVIVTWLDYRSGLSIYAQRLNAAGVRQWSTDGIQIVASTASSPSEMIPDGSGGAMLVWVDSRNFATTGSDILATRVSAAGVVGYGSLTVPVCVAPGSQVNPRIAATGLVGSAMIVWQDARGGSSADDIYAQRISVQGGGFYWANDGVPVCVNAGLQATPSAVPDGAGGAVVGWWDYRTPVNNGDVYAQRIDANGTVHWSTGGAPVCTKTSSQFFENLVPDGAGGAFFLWAEQGADGNFDQLAQRLDGSGVQQWGASGVQLCSELGSQDNSAALVSDGAGGAIAAFSLYTLYDDWDVKAQRVAADGSLLWGAAGKPVSSLPSFQARPIAVTDGASGAVMVFIDTRGTSQDLYAQRITSQGVPGDPEPVISGVRDVPNDQGGRVKVSWTASTFDLDPLFLISEYWIWRSVPPNAVVANGSALRRVTEDARAAASDAGAVYATSDGVATFYWEFVGSQPSGHLDAYSYLVATTSDSLPGSNPCTALMVQARTAAGASWWNSPPDSGYSVDNLAPASPLALAATFGPSTTNLHWHANTEPDLTGYRLYRGTYPDFDPDPAHLIATPSDTSFIDPVSAPYYYKLTAVDQHQNESRAASLPPPGPLSVVGGPTAQLALGPVRPNPAHRGPWTVALDLPDSSPARLEIMDVGGRIMLSRAVGWLGEGRHSIAISRPSGMAAGVYLLRLTQGPQAVTTKLVVGE